MQQGLKGDFSCDAVYSGRILVTVRRKALSSSSGPECWL
jgi:hypothetical protein